MRAHSDRRDVLKLGGLGAAAGLATLGASAASLLSPARAYAQAAGDSLLRTVLDRGKLIVGTGSTNAPWHFEDDKGKLTGMDIAMARILAKGLFDDETKVEFVDAGPGRAHPELITTGKVDITIQFMTISPARASSSHFTRPYYIEGVALLTSPAAQARSGDAALQAGGARRPRSPILQNVDADELVQQVLPQAQVHAARHPGERDPGAGVRARRRRGGRPLDRALAGQAAARQVRRRRQQLVLHALRRGDAAGRPGLAGLRQHVPSHVAMFGHQNEIFDPALEEFFGLKPPEREPGFPPI